MKLSTRITPLVVLLVCACSSANGGGAGGGTQTSSSASSTSGASSGTSSSSSTGSSSSSGGAGDTWASYVQGFFATYCVECHGASDPTGRDYTKLADVVKDASVIRCGVAATLPSGCGASPPAKQFPISDAAGTNPKPTDAERSRIVAWIAAGTP